jgi:hypothetical protein
MKLQRSFFMYLGLFSSLAFLLFFRPIVAFRVYSNLDDPCYLKMAAAILGQEGPSCSSTSYPPGAALAFLPATLMATAAKPFFVDSFSTVILPACVGVLSYAYYIATIALFGLILQLAFSRTSWPAGTLFSKKPDLNLFLHAMVFVGAAPVLYYGTHRTTLVHAPELFFSALTVYLAFQSKAKWAALSVMFLTSLRLNAFPAFFLLISQKVSRISRLWLGALFLGVVAYLGWMAWTGYNGMNLVILYKAFEPSRFYTVFFGSDWGLSWTAPFWLGLMIFGLARYRQINALSQKCVLWMLCGLAIVVAWFGNGSDFAYRYLIGTYAPAFLIWIEILKSDSERLRKWMLRLMVLNTFWLTWLNWIYKEHVSFHPLPDHRGIWTLLGLQTNSFLALFDPRFYVLSLRHSPIASLVETAVNPSGPSSFSGGVGDFRFILTSVLTVMALVGVFYFSVQMRRLGKTQKGESRWRN